MNKQNNIKESLEKLQNEKQKLINKKEKKISEEMYENKLVTINSNRLKSNNDYTYTFDSIKNVVEISLILYDIPKNIYNITKYNNKFIYKIDDEIHSFSIIPGNYKIDKLIELINKELINDNIECLLNKTTQLVEIKSTINSNFVLCKEKYTIFNILGFTENLYNDNNNFIANKLYDLRIDNTVTILIENIFGKESFATLDLDVSNSNINYTKKLNISKDIDRLSISFYSHDNNLIDFNGLTNKLTFNFKCLKNNNNDIPILNNINDINFKQLKLNQDIENTVFESVSNNTDYIKSMQIDQSDSESIDLNDDTSDNFDNISTLEELERYAKKKNLNI